MNKYNKYYKALAQNIGQKIKNKKRINRNLRCQKIV